MNTKIKQSLETFHSGYNCAQSVVSVFAEDLGVNRDAALKIAGSFGSGIAQTQQTCGAVTGALMALGLKYGKGENGIDADKAKTYKISGKFMAEFKKQHSSICCKDLLYGLDMTTPEGMAKIKELNLFQVRCAKLVQDAVTLTEQILQKEQ